MAVEAKRGCGYRKIGGLYLVGEGYGVPCDRLPIELTVCPCCGQGIKQGRGWQWVDTAALVGGDHMIGATAHAQQFMAATGTASSESVPCPCIKGCPLCHNTQAMGKSGLLWVGLQFYPTVEDFEREALAQGISRRIQTLPRGFELGKSWVLFAHAKAIAKNMDMILGKPETFTATYTPGIFRVWRPQRIERIYKESDRNSEAVLADEKRGITPVFVPDADRDHQGTAYDKETGEDTPPLFVEKA